MNFRNDIQGLRALAVLSVIIFHIQHEWLPGGFIGVDIFFVISGFLISKSIIEQKDKGQFNFFRFFIGRFKRIVPAYYVMLMVCIVAAIIYFPPNFFAPFFGQLLNTLFFLSNRVFGMWINYFGAQNHQNLLLHTWSLSIEMQFYIVLPFIIAVIPKKIRVSVLLLLFLVLLTYTEFNLRVLNENSKMYFSLPARSLEFMIGIAVNFLPKATAVKGKIKNVVGTAALLVIFISIFLVNETSTFPGLLSLPACIGTATIIWLQDSKINSFFSNKILVFIGTISYSLYLWHWPVLAFYRFQIDKYDIPFAAIFPLVFLFILLSLISFYTVEEPFRKMRQQKLYIYGGILTIGILTLAFGSKALNAKTIPIPIEYITPLTDMTNHHKYDGKYLIGDTNKESDNILLIGDSHCHSLRPFFKNIGLKYKLNFSTLSMNSMVPIYGCEDCEFLSIADKEVYSDLISVADSLITKADIIILIRQWQPLYDFEKQLTYLEKKISKNQSLVILTDFPALHQDPVRKFKSLLKPENMMREELIQPKIDAITLNAIARNHNFFLLDIKDDNFFSQAPYFNDTLMYYDAKHINVYGSKKLADFKGQKVAEFLLDLKSKQK